MEFWVLFPEKIDKRGKSRTAASFAFFTFFVLHLWSAVPSVFSQQRYPVIPELSSRNAVFRQFMQEVESAYMALFRGDMPRLSVYVYTAKADDTLMKIAARCSLPYETIAGLNRVPSPDVALNGKELYLPTVSGLFIPQKPESGFEYLLKKKDFDFDNLPCYTFNTAVFYFAAGGKLSATERAFFLDTGLRLPLSEGILTSAYGMRKSPITGADRFHDGIDLAAPLGTPVLACRAGRVAKTGIDRIYGKYVLLAHDNGSESLYAHLDSVLVVQGQSVARGRQIGKVGSTGLSTGPHLHFEIRIDGKSENPNALFSR